ncbi:MAG: hypothetical protein AB3N33_09900 [Puniceicoccaceae bacterium]
MGRILLFGVIIGIMLGGGMVNGGILQNEDFSSGLAGWDSQGAVFEGVEEVALTDENVNQSFLYQGVALDPGSYEVTVNFRQILSPAEPLGFAKDTFFASIYLSSTPDQFDPRVPDGFDGFLELFNFDSAGPFDFSGEFMEDPIRPDYLSYRQTLSLTEPSTVFTVFELTDLNGINDNSLVLVDSVVILIPEPLAALPLGIAVLTFLLIRRKVR